MDQARSFAEALEKAADSGDPNENLRDRWATLFQVAPDSPDYFLALTVLFQQSLEVTAEIDAAANINERAKGLYRGAAARLRPFVNPATAGSHNVNHLKGASDSIDMLYLASDNLPQRLVPDIQSVTLGELCSQLETLKDATSSADVPPEIRRLIITSLDTLLMALRSYHLFGPQGVSRIYGSVAAELARVAGDQQTPSAARGLLKRTVKTVTTIGAVVVWAGATVTGAHELLTHGPQVVEETAALIETGKLPPEADEHAPEETEQGSTDGSSGVQPTEQATQ